MSAFANTGGGRLLIGVKDNGKIAGIRSEEELYMIEAAATMYCKPALQLDNQLYRVEGKDVLEVYVPESKEKPVYALDEDNRPKAYLRIKDETILATPVHLNVWFHNKKEVVVTYTEKEQSILNLVGQHGELTLNKCVRLSGLPRKLVIGLLADFIRFDLVEPVFREHTFYFKLKSD